MKPRRPPGSTRPRRCLDETSEDPGLTRHTQLVTAPDRFELEIPTPGRRGARKVENSPTGRAPMVDLGEALRDVIREIVCEEVRTALADVAKPERHLSTAAAAELAGVHVDTIRRWIAIGRLARLSAGRHAKVRRTELEALLAAPPAPVVEVPLRAKKGGRFRAGPRVQQPRARRDTEELTPEELARRDFG
jgi:excisionase family DNA binding protein